MMMMMMVMMMMVVLRSGWDDTALLLGRGPREAPIHYQTQSYDTISCYGNSLEWTCEISYCILVPA